MKDWKVLFYSWTFNWCPTEINKNNRFTDSTDSCCPEFRPVRCVCLQELRSFTWSVFWCQVWGWTLLTHGPGVTETARSLGDKNRDFIHFSSPWQKRKGGRVSDDRTTGRRYGGVEEGRMRGENRRKWSRWRETEPSCCQMQWLSLKQRNRGRFLIHFIHVVANNALHWQIHVVVNNQYVTKFKAAVSIRSCQTLTRNQNACFQHVCHTSHTDDIHLFLAPLTLTEWGARSCKAKLTSWTNLVTAMSHDIQVSLKDFFPYAYIVKGVAAKWWMDVLHIIKRSIRFSFRLAER